MVSTVSKNILNGFRQLLSTRIPARLKHLKQIVEKFCDRAEMRGRP